MRHNLVGPVRLALHPCRVAVSLGLLGFDVRARRALGVRRTFDSMRHDQSAGPRSVADPARRHDADRFGAILDWLDQQVGPERALLPRAGARRDRQALQRIALATRHDRQGHGRGLRALRPYRSATAGPDWVARCRTQAEGGLARADCSSPGRADARLRQDWITTRLHDAAMYGLASILRPAADWALSDRIEAVPTAARRCRRLRRRLGRAD